MAADRQSKGASTRSVLHANACLRLAESSDEPVWTLKE